MEVEHNLEDARFLDIIEWENPENAFLNLKIKYDYLWHSWDPELYICIEISSKEPKYFDL